MSTTTLILLLVLAAETAALVTVSVLWRKAKKAGRARRVEGPNSQFRSPYVLDLEARERWESMDLERLHEVNREEVVCMLGKVRAGGVRNLTPAERDFLDRMADAQDRVQGPTAGRRAAPPRSLPRPS